MKKFDTIGLFVVMAAFFVLVITPNAGALTEKEQWAKDHGESLRISPAEPPVILDHGGPDGGGYYYIDSDDDANNAPVYDWIDISGDGTEIPMTDDSNQGPFALGFNVEFYGNTFSSVNVCSNGFLSFTSTSTAYTNASIPTSGEPNNLLAAYWDDLNPSNGGQIFYKQDTDPNGRLRFIVSWVGVPFYLNAGSMTFEAIIYEDGNIFYQYSSLDGGSHGLASGTVGIENSDGTIGTQYSYNEEAIHEQMAIYFGLTPPIYADHDVRPEHFQSPVSNIGPVGDEINPVVQFRNSGGNTESFPARLIVDHNGEVYNETLDVTDLAPGGQVDVAFPPFTPSEEGDYDLIAISELSGDEIPSNDTLRFEFSALNNIYIEDFEADDGMFVGDNDWEWGNPTSGPNGAHSGQNVWATILGGNYNVGPLLSALITPELGLGDAAQMTFWHWYNIENLFDGGNVKISTDNGATWEILTPDGGYDGVISTTFQNPLGGEQGFYGNSGGWVMETFDLSGLGGNSVLIKFDFGTDTSVQYPGWYIDDITIYGGGVSGLGWVAGVVTDLDSGDPIEGATVSAGSVGDQTNQDGEYILQLFPGIYSLTATAQYHSPVTIGGVEVVEEDTTTQDFALPAPVIQVDTTPIETTLSPGQTAEFSRNVANIGSGDLNFNIGISFGDRRLRREPKFELKNSGRVTERRPDDLASTVTDYARISSPGNPPTILDFGDEVYVFDPQTPTGDEGCLGVEFDGTYFWVTGRYPDPGDDVHKLHKFDRDGNLIQSYDQGTISTWGWRDLAWDGQYLYASDENELAIIDPGTGQKIGELPMPGGFTPPLRALAYDPATDHFWTANFNSNILEFDRDGQVVGVYANSLLAYGMAWDDVSEGGPYLWVFSQDGTPPVQVSQFDPTSGEYTGVVFHAIDHGGEGDDAAGGACFTTEWDPTTAILFCLVQGVTGGHSADLVQGYEIAPFSRWLIVDPMTGVLAPSENVDLAITLDFTGDDVVPDSIYEAQIIVNNTSQETPIIPVTVDVVTGIDDGDPGLPREFTLFQNYPNPFNPSTTVKFALPEPADVSIDIFNVLGQKVESISEGLLPAGFHRVVWDGSKAASGVYFYRIKAGNFVDIKKMTLLK